MARIFISYKRNDLNKIIPIKNRIEASLNETCWFDLSGIESTDYFTNVIINAINNAEIVLFMYTYSHTFIKDYGRDWTIREITYAMNRNKRIVFINVDGTPLTDWFDFNFGPQQQIEAQSPYQLDKLINEIKNWLKKEVDPNFPEIYYQKGADCQYKDQNYVEALKWYIEAARFGHIDAQFKVGVFYENGWGTSRDVSEAAKWYQMAAEKGSVKAQYTIGKMFLEGRGVPQGYGNGVKWLRDAARNGSEEARGVLHELGVSAK